MKKIYLKEDSLHKYAYYAITDCTVHILDTETGSVSILKDRCVIQKVNKKTGRIVLVYDQNDGKRIELAAIENEPKQVRNQCRLWSTENNTQDAERFILSWYKDACATAKKYYEHFTKMEAKFSNLGV